MNQSSPGQFEHLIGLTVQTLAHAKLNLRLKITGRRDDGFHLLSMINSEISLADEIALTFDREPGVRLETVAAHADANFSDPARNLAARAASSYLHELSTPLGVTIRLRKNVPVGSGLGGGSSDAAAVLRLLHTQVRAPNISREKLNGIGLSLGADVPYFLQRGVCHVTGVGERVRMLSARALRGAPVFLFVPKTPIATPELYALYRTRFPKLIAQDDAAALATLGTEELSYHETVSLVENDFESLLQEFAPAVWDEISLVRRVGGLRVGLTGSGSAFFALSEQRTEPAPGALGRLQDLVSSTGTKVLALRLLAADQS